MSRAGAGATLEAAERVPQARCSNISRRDNGVTARRLGTVLMDLRKAKKLTQVELSKKAGVTQGYLASLEGGLKKNPSLAVLKRLAKALGVPVTELLE